MKTVAKRMLYNVKSCLMFHRFEIGKYKRIHLPSIYTSLMNSCIRSQFKVVRFLQFPIRTCLSFHKILEKGYRLVNG